MENRVRFAARIASKHLLISFFIAACSMGLIYLWYPMPYRLMLGVGGIWIIILLVDVLSGPFITLLVSNPKKSTREMAWDLAIIGSIQVAALFYGLHSVWLVRPVVLAFERDRLVVVSANEIESNERLEGRDRFRISSFGGVIKVATRDPENNAELFESVELSLGGITPAMRPLWWVPFESRTAEIEKKSKPLVELLKNKSRDKEVLMQAANKTGLATEDILYLPLTSSRNKDWVALLSRSLEIVGYAPVDGFE